MSDMDKTAIVLDFVRRAPEELLCQRLRFLIRGSLIS